MSKQNIHKKQTQSKKAAVKCSNVLFNIGKNAILQDVSFSIEQGKSIAIIGPNGGGKSTLLSLLLGITVPHSGSIKLLGEKPKVYCKKCSVLFQHYSTRSAFPITVKEVVSQGLYGHSISKIEKEEKVQSALSEARLLKIAEEKIDAISGGQRQRTYLARTLVSNSDTYFFDEPTSFLDDEAENYFYEKIIELKKNGKTTLIISHDISVLPTFADGLLCVNKHVSLMQKDELLNKEKRASAFEELYKNPHLKMNLPNK